MVTDRRLAEALARDQKSRLEALPFTIIRKDGLVHIDAKVDAAFRKSLMNGIPVALRGKMREALAATPDKGSLDHSYRYFGGPEKVADIKNRIAPLLIELNRYLSESQSLPGIFDWLEATGFGNDYRMIKAFLAWAEMANMPSLAQIASPPKPKTKTYG